MMWAKDAKQLCIWLTIDHSMVPVGFTCYILKDYFGGNKAIFLIAHTIIAPVPLEESKDKHKKINQSYEFTGIHDITTTNTLNKTVCTVKSLILVGNKIVDHSDIVGASPVGTALTTSSFST